MSTRGTKELVDSIKLILAKHEVNYPTDLPFDLAQFVLNRQSSYWKKGIGTAQDANRAAERKVFGRSTPHED